MRNNNIKNNLCHVLHNENIFDENQLQFVSVAVVNINERNEQSFQHKKKIYKILSDQINDNSLLSEILKIQREYSKELAAVRPTYIFSNQTSSQSCLPSAFGSSQQAVSKVSQFYRHQIQLCRRTALYTEHLITKSLPFLTKIQKTDRSCSRHDASTECGLSDNKICCTCKNKSGVLNKYSKCNSGHYFSKRCQGKQFTEHKKYCDFLVELESLNKPQWKEYLL